MVAAWYETLFNDDYLRLWGPSLTPERTEAEVEGLLRLLGPEAGAEILDVCCGHGRHAIPLAERGYRMTGFDLSEVFLERAQSDAEARGVTARWVRGDMRELPFRDEFAAAYNMFTAFGYFEEPENQVVLDGIAAALRPGGTFLIDVLARDSLARRFQPGSITRHEDGTVVLEERMFDLVSGRCHTRMTELTPDGRRVEREFATRVYTPTELCRMVEMAGLSVAGVYGGLDGSPMTLEARRLVVVARKP